MNNDISEMLGITTEVTSPPTDAEIMSEYEDDMWVDKDKRLLNENTFAKAFRDINHLLYSNGLFYTKEHRMTQEMVMRDIWET